jgi:predicted metal-dependent hydrolase
VRRRLPNIPLPNRRYVPGEMPHPRHLSASVIPTLALATVDSIWLDTRWLYGLDLFDAAFYWESHEVWEELWHTLGKTEPDAQLIQGMIQLAASLLTAELGREAASIRLLARAQAKLQVGQDIEHPAYPDVSRSLEYAHLHRGQG